MEDLVSLFFFSFFSPENMWRLHFEKKKKNVFYYQRICGNDFSIDRFGRQWCCRGRDVEIIVCGTHFRNPPSTTLYKKKVLPKKSKISKVRQLSLCVWQCSQKFSDAILHMSAVILDIQSIVSTNHEKVVSSNVSCCRKNLVCRIHTGILT